jgi:diadenylate cyclase
MFGYLLEHAVVYVKVGIEIGLLAVLIYLALQFVRETRAVAILAGTIILALGLSILSRAFDLEVIGWLVGRMWAGLAFASVIVFQPEVRRALSEIGRRPGLLLAHGHDARSMDLVNTLVDATFFLADRRIGALIAIEQSIGLRSYAETGTPIDAAVSSKLLSSVFFPNTPLHDGGVIIRRDQIVAAGCIFPLSQSPDLGKTLGTRHRAGVGLCEETDAVVIIVSEESGAVSLARSGRLTRGVARERLTRHLTNYLVKKATARRSRGMLRWGTARVAADTPTAGEA